MSGILDGQVGRLASVVLAGHRLTDVLVTYPASEHQNPRGITGLNGNLGTGILHRFKTTFDYANNRMLLEPNESFDEPFPYNTAGVVLAHSKDLVIEFVIAGSPAEEAGVQPGDKLTHIDNKPVDGPNARWCVRPSKERAPYSSACGEQARTSRLRSHRENSSRLRIASRTTSAVIDPPCEVSPAAKVPRQLSTIQSSRPRYHLPWRLTNSTATFTAFLASGSPTVVILQW